VTFEPSVRIACCAAMVEGGIGHEPGYWGK
jgi:hypothetical protein